MIKEIKFTDNAIKQINYLLSKKEKGSFFRIAIKGGGCSGFQYNFSVDTGKGYRALVNVSEYGGQEVPHLHFHLFGGEKVGKMVQWA